MTPPLTALEFDLLVYLIRQCGRVVGKGAILRDVLQANGSPENVRAHVCHLRRKLGDSGKRHIRTVRREGYAAMDAEAPVP
jgi:DNA-binding response OmpR family regulator